MSYKSYIQHISLKSYAQKTKNEKVGNMGNILSDFSKNILKLLFKEI